LLALAGCWLLHLTQRALRAMPRLEGLVTAGDGELLLRWPRRPLAQVWVIAGSLSVCLLLLGELVLLAKGHVFVAALLPLLVVVALLWLRELRLGRPDGGVRLFLLTLLGLGFGLSIGVDLVTINGDINRMNTVFKFYLHAWVAFALVAGFAAWYLLFVIWPPALAALRLPASWRNLSLDLGSVDPRRAAAVLGSGSLALLVVAALVYPLFATPPRLRDRFAQLPSTLDGSAYMQTAVYSDAKGPMELKYDYEGIQWMRDNVEGSPVIAEGRAELYRWGGRFSIYTGLPSVVGWDWHQRQQRGKFAFAVEERVRDLDAFYNGTDVAGAQAFLRQYDVAYVVVGQVERLYYERAGIDKLERGLGGMLQPVFQNQGLTIYEVRDSSAIAGR
jgi:uncharacterized membrane protein